MWFRKISYGHRTTHGHRTTKNVLHQSNPNLTLLSNNRFNQYRDNSLIDRRTLFLSPRNRLINQRILLRSSLPPPIYYPRLTKLIQRILWRALRRRVLPVAALSIRANSLRFYIRVLYRPLKSLLSRLAISIHLSPPSILIFSPLNSPLRSATFVIRRGGRLQACILDVAV